jgi:hypothetical protein
LQEAVAADTRELIGPDVAGPVAIHAPLVLGEIADARRAVAGVDGRACR